MNKTNTILLALSLLLISAGANAQKYMTRTGKISFYSSTPMENIEAYNNEVASIADAGTGDLVFQVPIKSFKFEKALMQEHFNENYMESDTYPKAEFKGKINDFNKVDVNKDGTYTVTAAGKLTMHGVTQDVAVPGSIVIKGTTMTIQTKFNVRPADYKIKVPAMVAGKIASEIEVTVKSILDRK